MTPYAIHITGASGSGVSTLGRALAARTGAVQLDTDDYYWLPVKPDYTQKRLIPERLALLDAAMADAGARGWILSGSISEWGKPLVPRFRLVVFVRTPVDIRLQRLRAREIARYGADAIAPGGERFEAHREFVAWAKDYDAGTAAGRNLAKHEAFLAEMTCPVVRVDGARETEILVEEVMRVLGR
jgi:adenylate kinase family enzyme